MAEYIEREALLDAIINDHQDLVFYSKREAIECIAAEPAADVAPVVHGRWELTVHSFYRDTFDESCELCVYIVANCSECSCRHPVYTVYTKTLFGPEDADDSFQFDQKSEEEKALNEFRQRGFDFAFHCPSCGARMDDDG